MKIHVPDEKSLPMNPAVSVILPCFNQGAFIEEAIGSVLVQATVNFEIVVINDGSTDEETLRVLDRAAWPRTRIIHSENHGVSHARNTAIGLASGEFILPLDADDRIGPGYLEKAASILSSRPDVGIVYCNARFFGDVEGPWPLPEYSLPEMLVHNLIFCTALFRKADWRRSGGYKEEMRSGWEDYEFWLSLIERGADVVRLPETLFYYRQKTMSRSRELSVDQRIELRKRIYRLHRDLYAGNIEALLREITLQEESLAAFQAECARLRLKYSSAGLWNCFRRIFREKNPRP